MTVRVGVIGVGYLGRHHARVYAELEGVKLVAVADTHQKQAEDIARQHGCKAYTDYKQMFDSVDAISIVTPTINHYSIACDCITAGKDLLIEKPITTTVDEADDLIRQAKTAKVLLQVGHLERFNPVVAAFGPLVQEPVFFEAQRISPFQGRGTDVDITLDLMIHDIDIILSLMPGRKIIDIKASGVRVLTKTIDLAKAWIHFDNGTGALLTASRVASEKTRTLTVYDRDRHMVMDYQSMEIRRYFAKDGAVVHDVMRVEPAEPLKEELRHFIACTRTRTTPRVCGLKGRDALTVAMQAGYEIKKRWEKA
ncbi:MAG TPA: Gfo/Idh/MocA family oxidoreductase [Dissulfurispiraceae bacterium]|nr:Gfo/Idh/MocA family oxidoreductase [Dissulfurispiraceae bacterium]